MKQLIVVAFLCLAGAHFANAQVKKGNVLVGGTAGVKWEKYDYKDVYPTNKSTQYIITPQAGYAFKDNWVAGVAVRGIFGKSKWEAGNGSPLPSDIHSYILNTGVFVRHYKMIGNKFGLFGEGGVYYGYGSGRQNDVKYSDMKTYSVEAQPGIAYFVNKRWMIEGKFGGLNYQYSKHTDIMNNRKSSSSGFSFDFGQQFELGVAFLF